MDHIWGAPSSFKKSLALIFLEKLAIILRQDFLKTLYGGGPCDFSVTLVPIVQLNLDLGLIWV